MPNRLVAALFFAALFASTTVVAGPKVNGRIETVGPYRLLRVWGTSAEMGFAHGYLIGKGFPVFLTAFLESTFGDAVGQYEFGLASLQAIIRIPADAADEIRAIFEGIKAANGKPPEIVPLKRPMRVEDLIYLNAFDTIRAFGCSGFTVWGERAGDAGVITTRNFDFKTYGPKAVAEQLIIVRQPAGRRQVATIAWPGYIGAFTGINDAGVAAFMHDGTGPGIDRPQGQYVPIALVTKGILEVAEPADARDRARTALSDIVSPFSYMVRIVTPRVPGMVERPASVFRIDMNGCGENAMGPDRCITTNHYLDAEFKTPDSAGAWSVKRYRILKSRLTGSVTAESAWASLRAVAFVNGDDRAAGTLHSLVLYPELRRLDFALATWTKTFTAAPMHDPVSVTFDRLFALPGG